MWSARESDILELKPVEKLARACAWLRRKGEKGGGLALATASIAASCLENAELTADINRNPRLTAWTPDQDTPLLCYATTLAAYRLSCRRVR